jgi:hypothetical protein
MGVYNLYLLDETRDPKVVARLSRVTGLAEGVVRREVRHPPFLILREHGLSQAVSVRRDFEQMGLNLRLELVDQPTGQHTHPLAGEQAPDDGGEIVLEEGRGFREAEGVAAAPRPPDKGRRDPRRAWRWAALLLALLLAGSVVLWRMGGQEGDPRQILRRQVAESLPGLEARLADLLARPEAPPAERDSLDRELARLETAARPIWDELPQSQRRALEGLAAGRRTLEMRRERQVAAGSAPTRPLASLLSPPALRPTGEFWEDLDREWKRRAAPAGLGELLALEGLVEQSRAIRQGGDPAAAARLMGQEARDPGGLERMGARSLAGSLRQKGVVWTGTGSTRQGWADLPDSTVLDVSEDNGRVHLARVEGGRLVFEEPPGELASVSVRLAALELQPKGVRRLLEAGLRLFAPEVYFATLPGSRLPRLNPAAAEAAWNRAGDPALKKELERLGLRSADLRHPVLERDAALPGGDADLVDWLRAAAARYEKALVWPQTLELRTPDGRFRVSGCELWHLTRPGMDA